MKYTKKFFAVLMAAALTICGGNMIPTHTDDVQAAETINWETVKATELSDMTNFEKDVNLTWKLEYHLDKDNGISEETKYAQFTLSQDSIVRILESGEDEGAFSNQKQFKLFGNQSMGTPLLENTFEYGSGDDWIILSAGTYYMSCKSALYMSSKSDHTLKISIGAVPVAKAVTFTQTIDTNKTKVTVKVNNHLSSNVSDYQYQAGQVDTSAKWNWTGYTTVDGVTALSGQNPSFSVTKNGWYTIRYTVESTVAWNQELTYCAQVQVTGIDTTKPTISGVKNGKIYKKAVTIKYADKNGSGVKSAKLNKKSTKSGTKISKDGVYTLVVTDKAGNSNTVKFTVDKTKPTANVKANKTYKKGKKITFKDKTSGIKKATLNGKTIKSGAKATKKGSNVLKITDKAGNVTTIRFKIS